MREIEKMQINLVDNENNVRIFVLRRMNEDTGILWKYEDALFRLEIFTNDEIKNVEIKNKSENLAESDEMIEQKFLDAVFEYKMNLLINKEDGFDDAEEEEIEKNEKVNPCASGMIDT